MKSQNNSSIKESDLITKEDSFSKIHDSDFVLNKVGGFDYLESIIEGLANLNPQKKVRKNIFLSDPNKKFERDQLKKRLTIWLDLLNRSETLGEAIDHCAHKAKLAEFNFNRNLGFALLAIKEIEENYRSLAMFYNNTDTDKVSNIVLLNSSLNQIQDLENPKFINHVAEELKQNFDRLDLRDNYSMLVIPGFLGSNRVIDKWAKIAHENKVMLITDFANLDSPEDVVEVFTQGNYTGAEMFRSNVIMTCNWLVARGKYEQYGETEDIVIPPSTALAGKMYNTLLSQVAAGKKHGVLNEADAVQFDLKKSEISHIESLGLVPMVNEYGKVMAFSAKTLFNGDNLGLQTYSVVRVFDHIAKVLFDFLNRKAFENWTTKTENDLRTQIVKFLDSIQGPDRLIEKFKIMRLEQDLNQKDRVLIDINITPYFPAKSFVVKLDGQKGEEGASWNSEYAPA